MAVQRGSRGEFALDKCSVAKARATGRCDRASQGGPAACAAEQRTCLSCPSIDLSLDQRALCRSWGGCLVNNRRYAWIRTRLNHDEAPPR
jgi:hypothetical protein